MQTATQSKSWINVEWTSLSTIWGQAVCSHAYSVSSRPNWHTSCLPRSRTARMINTVNTRYCLPTEGRRCAHTHTRFRHGQTDTPAAYLGLGLQIWYTQCINDIVYQLRAGGLSTRSPSLVTANWNTSWLPRSNTETNDRHREWTMLSTNWGQAVCSHVASVSIRLNWHTSYLPRSRTETYDRHGVQIKLHSVS